MVVVHGHTPVDAPAVRPNRIGIDTGAVFSGRLTALRLQGRGAGFFADLKSGSRDFRSASRASRPRDRATGW